MAYSAKPRGHHVTTAAPVIEIRNLHKAYGALEVLKGVDISAARGDVISLIGSSGSGKSTLLSDFTKPLLGELETSVLGSSTEAGLRQNLGSDAIPVLMDEAEQAQARDEERIQAVMELARASSSETGSKTLKGTASGTGQEYLIRSMFMSARSPRA